MFTTSVTTRSHQIEVIEELKNIFESAKCMILPHKGLPKVLLLIVFLILIISGCTNNKPLSVDYFPTDRHSPPAGMPVVTAGMTLTGKLNLDNNVLWVRRYFGFIPIPFQNYLIIWPYGYSVKVENDDIQILDRSNHPVAQNGHTIYLEGTFIQPEDVDYFLSSPLPDGIEGPFFLAGKVVDDYFTSSSSK